MASLGGDLVHSAHSRMFAGGGLLSGAPPSSRTLFRGAPVSRTRGGPAPASRLAPASGPPAHGAAASAGAFSEGPPRSAHAPLRVEPLAPLSAGGGQSQAGPLSEGGAALRGPPGVWLRRRPTAQRGGGGESDDDARGTQQDGWMSAGGSPRRSEGSQARGGASGAAGALSASPDTAAATTSATTTSAAARLRGGGREAPAMDARSGAQSPMAGAGGAAQAAAAAAAAHAQGRSGGVASMGAALRLGDGRGAVLVPAPRGGPAVQCTIVRDRTSSLGLRLHPLYTLCVRAGGGSIAPSTTAASQQPRAADAFLLAARKRAHNKTSNYVMSLNASDLNRDSPAFVGKLRSNFVGTEFTIFDDGAAAGKLASAPLTSPLAARGGIGAALAQLSSGSGSLRGQGGSESPPSPEHGVHAPPPLALGSPPGGGGAQRSRSPELPEAQAAGLQQLGGPPPLPPPAQRVRAELGVITYAANVLGSRGPRKMKVALPRLRADGSRATFGTLPQGGAGAPALTGAGAGAGAGGGWGPALGVLGGGRPAGGGAGAGGLDEDGMLSAFRHGYTQDMTLLINKPPRWNDAVGAFVLNFGGRVTQASVKNFQLVSADDHDTVLLQFGRCGKDTFTMDFSWPLCALQAFAICLSSFDRKLACE